MIKLLHKTKFELMNHGDTFFTLIGMVKSSDEGNQTVSLKVFRKLLKYFCQKEVVSELVNQGKNHHMIYNSLNETLI